MKPIVTVFQFEIRYNHILNFSQIGRKIIAPYVKLAQSIRVENQNTLEERLILNFEEDEFLIIASWDRLLIKGQGGISKYIENNSPIEMPFLDILNKLTSLTEFGTINNILFAINYIKKIDIDKKDLFSFFTNKHLNPFHLDLIDNFNDTAIVLESKTDKSEEFLTFGPYFDVSEIEKRPIIPMKIEKLENVNFSGIMAEYKYLLKTSEVSQVIFNDIVKSSQQAINKLWKTF